MDLLDKIRQKFRQEQEDRHPDATPSLEEELPESAVFHGVGSTHQMSVEKDLLHTVEAANAQNENPEIVQAFPSVQRIVARDPLEAILAGREASGCGEDLPLIADASGDTEQDNYSKFLCFKVSNEVYGIDIMDIKELIKPRAVTEVPRAPSFVSGIISLRGVIIPIIDMLDRLGLSRETVTGRERVIVVRQGESFSGLLVDEIIQVVHVAQEDIEAAPIVLEGIDSYFVTGIGRADGRMIILLNLSNIIDIHLY